MCLQPKVAGISTSVHIDLTQYCMYGIPVIPVICISLYLYVCNLKGEKKYVSKKKKVKKIVCLNLNNIYFIDLLYLKDKLCKNIIIHARK